ncbi:nitronate monooxygenase [Sporichthya sp.]|uniref:NAD(P)H-dependent flavin oxidoreductase n=1 Tax=Sporichthya sp. TaxID=65475 RepID=UPI001792CC85|nr:nitronate monooxygenase [Sporichthya sp.]MBA3741424.1 nitronate monooxygenase [Sporichthya sp.]
MRTEICRRLNIEYPILAFSHCRDVVAAVTRAGGMGVFGAQRYTPEELDIELTWLDENTDGGRYGVDVLIPASRTEGDLGALKAQIPAEVTEYVDKLLAEFGLPNEPVKLTTYGGITATHNQARDLLEVAFTHADRVAFIASALGPAPADVRDRAHGFGMQVMGMAGSVRHATKQAEAGTDIIVAVGTEAAGHTGDISTMVLVPDIVDAVPGIPVVAAGGIGGGRQLAAALALGAEGVWCGSVWMTTVESEVDPIVRDMLIAATAGDTVRSKFTSGKPVRFLRTPWNEAWLRPGAPAALPMPLQGLAVQNAMETMKQNRRFELLGTAAGQVIGRLNKVTTSRDVVNQMAVELADTVERLSRLADED